MTLREYSKNESGDGRTRKNDKENIIIFYDYRLTFLFQCSRRRGLYNNNIIVLNGWKNGSSNRLLLRHSSK